MKTMAASSFIRFTLVFVLGLATILPSNARAQEGLFQTAITVNDLVITNYEIDQRTRLLTLLRAPGDPAEEARKGLIEDRLRQSETQRVGIELTEDQILSGMEEFAARVNLPAEQFITIIERAGVARETFRDFVSAGLAWRGYVQGRFGPRSQVSEAEVDRAVSLQGARGGARVLLAEIILPLAPQVAERNTNLANQLSDSLTSEAAFSSAARRYSASPTRGRGGRLDWLPLGNVPPPVRAAVLTLAPGETSDPVNLGQAIALFQLRALEETEAATPETQALEYATILIPGGRSERALTEAQKLRDEYDTCDDLYKPAQSLPAEYFDRVVLPTAEVPGDIALELAKLDDNEDSFALTRQGDAFLVYLKLCGRTVSLPLNEDGEEIDLRTQIRDQLFNQRLASFASSALAELQAEAIIIEE